MKNKLLLNITTILALALFSCAGESMENDAISTRSQKDEPAKIIYALEEQNIELTSEQKEAFQLRAIQKFYDFTDYVKIISDPNVDNDLKNHSINLMEELFINDSISFQYKQHSSINTKSINFIIPLSLDSLNNYTGTIRASLIINGEKITKKIDVHLVQIEKLFGEKKQNIIEVRLGNIY